MDNMKTLFVANEEGLTQDEIVRKRIREIKEHPELGISEEELDRYLKLRGVKIDEMDS